MEDYLEKYGLKSSEKNEKSLLSKCYCFAKNYFGLLPVSGGIIFTGSIYSVLYTIGTANYIASNPMDILNASKSGEILAAEWSKIGLPVGQFLTYTAMNRLKNFANEIFGNGGGKNG